MKYNQPIGAAEGAPYIDENPSTGTEGSPVPAKALEAPQREIVNVILAAGLVPDEDDDTQLQQAIEQLIPEGGDMFKANNLSDVTDKDAARNNIGVLPAKGTTIAAAATTDIGNADSSYVEISGSGYNITSFGTSTKRNVMILKFLAAGTITYNATSLITPNKQNMAVQPGDKVMLQRVTGGNWEVVIWVRVGGGTDALATAIASAATLDLNSINGNGVHVTGNAAITAMTIALGRVVKLIFDSTPTITNGAALICPTGANIVAAAGDVAYVMGDSAGARIISYMRANGKQLAAITGPDLPAGVQIGQASATYLTTGTITTSIPIDNTKPQNTEGTEIISLSYTPKKIGDVIEISAEGEFTSSTSGSSSLIAALFGDFSTDALRSTFGFCYSSYLYPGNFTLKYMHTVTSLTPIVFSLRLSVGAIGSGIVTNGQGASGANNLGGTMATVLTVKENIV